LPLCSFQRLLALSFVPICACSLRSVVPAAPWLSFSPYLLTAGQRWSARACLSLPNSVEGCRCPVR
jgi:hypothetical protein